MRSTRVLPLLAAVACLVTPAAGHAQEIPRDDYFRFLPLETPQVNRQTEASARLHLFGDRETPGYVDRAPADGIDDSRHGVLESLAVRFAPLLIQNSTAVPMDFRRFTGADGAASLHVDTWNLNVPGGNLVDQLEIDYLYDPREPCSLAPPQRSDSRNDDCRLLELLDDFDPENPASAVERTAARLPNRKLYRVLWMDLPGRGPEDWKREYVEPLSKSLPGHYRDYLITFVHPFAVDVRGADGQRGHELILQYWFFYPFNDGGNNHLGDWEHINVAISPMEAVERPLTTRELASILSGESLRASGPDQLVIKRIEYYFHSNVMTLDFATPNAYAPRGDWETEIANRETERLGEPWFWREIRYRAWLDDEETLVNTHPIGFIGADNKGLDQLLSSPGGTNRDSHGTFPMPGLFKDIGPAGAAEGIDLSFDHRDYFAADESGREELETWRRGGVISLASDRTVEIVPDFERVHPLVEQDVGVRQQWSWLLLPMRFGYPAVESPFAGVVAHAETGNVAVVGPSFNSGWNRSGATEGYRAYAPHKVSRLFPLAWQDGFQNSWGWLNLTAPTLAMLPPIDFMWRLVAAPIRSALGSNDPTFYPQDEVPVRFFGGVAGTSHVNLGTEYLDLLFNAEQFDQLIASLLTVVLRDGSENTVAVDGREFVDDVDTFFGQVSFYVGDRFVTTSMLRNSRANLGFEVLFSDIASPWTATGELNLWDYEGSFRYDLTTGNLRVFPKVGYGLSWYRIENLETEGEPLPTPDSDWIRKPSLFPFENVLPNTWNFGGGFEWLVLTGYGSPPSGIDVSLLVEWTYRSHDLGLDVADLDLETLVLLGRTAENLPRDRQVGRSDWKFGLSVSF